MQKRTRMYVCSTYVHPCSFLHLKPLIYWHIYPLKRFFCTTFLQLWVAFHWIPSQIIWFHPIQIDCIRPRCFGKCCAFKSQPSSLIRSFPFDSSTDCPGAMLTPSLHHHHAFWDSLTPPPPKHTQYPNKFPALTPSNVYWPPHLLLPLTWWED